MPGERFEIRRGAIDEFVEAVVANSAYSSADEARTAGWPFDLADVQVAMGSRHGDGPAWQLFDFAYLMCAKQVYLLPPGFGAKGIFPVVEAEDPDGFRVEVCIDGAEPVRSPRFDARAIIGPRPANFDESVRRLHLLAERLAEWGTKLAPSARAFATEDA